MDQTERRERAEIDRALHDLSVGDLNRRMDVFESKLDALIDGVNHRNEKVERRLTALETTVSYTWKLLGVIAGLGWLVTILTR